MYLYKKVFLVFLICLFGLQPVFSGGSDETSGKKTSTSVSTGKEPDWVRNPYAKYDEKANVAAVGRGSSQDMSEKDALGRIVAIFGQSIQVDEKVSMSYQEAVKAGITDNWSENTSINSSIATSAGMDSLIGAETGETWDDGKGTFFTIAFLNKAKAAQQYTEMVRSNQAMINNLINMSAEEKNSLEGFARYQFAATIADITISYGNLLSVIDKPVQELKKGDEYRLEAVNITKAIPVGLSVKNDKSGRIQGAFAEALSGLGFRSGGNDSRYVLDVDVATSPVALAGNENKFSRIELKANLTDTNFGSVLVPYNFNLREGHTSQAEADNRAYASAERKIKQEYSALLNNYLSGLLPKK